MHAFWMRLLAALLIPPRPGLAGAYAFCPSFCASPCATRRIQKRDLARREGWLDAFLPNVDNDRADADRRSAYPEQYPATYDLSTLQVEDDDEDAAHVRPLLKQTQLVERPLMLAYDSTEHGWSPQTFHSKVDGKGAAVVLATTETGRIVGGYNPKGWSSLGGARPSVAAFLFYSTGENDDDDAPSFQKLRKVGGGGLACASDDPNFGISFGPDSLVVGLQPGRERWAQSKLGPYYERGPEDLPSLFLSEGGGANLASLKVLVGKYQPGEDIPYSGGVLDMTSG